VVDLRADGQSAWVTSRLEFFKQPSWMKQFPFAMSLRGKAQRLDVVLGASYRAVVITRPNRLLARTLRHATSSVSSRWQGLSTR
jgi:hypothetical protein